MRKLLRSYSCVDELFFVNLQSNFTNVMIELSRHIEILLLENDCVIVPGLGGFMAHYIHAEYSEQDNTFYPPQRTMGFNSQLRLNDSLLAQSYVEAYDISYPEAVRRITSEVEEVRQTIAIEGKFEFYGIGTLKYTSEERYEFEPCAAGLLTPSLYALSSFGISEIASSEATVTLPVSGALLGEDVENPALDEALTDAEVEYDGDTLKVNMAVVRNVLMAAAMLLLFVFSSIPVGTGSNNVLQCSVIDANVVPGLVKAPEVVDTMLLSAEEDTMQAGVAAVEVVPEVQESVADMQNSFFTIVLASKVGRAGAEEFVGKMKSAGYEQAGIYETSTKRKVILGRYATAAEAANALDRFRNASRAFAEAWIDELTD